jgi:hypothetical protein
MTTRRQSALQASFRRPSALFVALVSVLGIVLTPFAVLAVAMGAWRLGADPGWTATSL